MDEPIPRTCPVAIGYQGYCQFCGREIGTGHEQGCPYWRPKPADPPRPGGHPDAVREGDGLD